jgi:hypothetical protein
MSRVLVVALAVMIAAQADAQTITCTANHNAMMQAELLFGRNIDGRPGVTEKAWARFLADEITPRFPDGLTVYDAAGQYRESPAAKVVRERSKIVMILVEAGDAAMQRIDEIVGAYKKRFRQKSVGVVIKPACVSFHAS